MGFKFWKMKSVLLNAVVVILLFLSSQMATAQGDFFAEGSQPQVSMEPAGDIRMVYGRNDSIFCVTSNDDARTFSPPVYVGRITGMHLGMTRGPVIASSASSSIVTAIDKTGNIHFFRLEHAAGKWKYGGLVNDIKSTAPEGLMGIAADDRDNFYAVWLDIRQGRKNNISFSSFTRNEAAWSENRIIYTSPDEHVCECCKPNISVEGSGVNIMFRNWLDGSRDLYLINSPDKGKTFGEARKIGAGTWKLKGCPMDGGGVTTDNSGSAYTVWQREGEIYYCKPGEMELRIAAGRGCSIAENNKDIVSFQEGNEVKILDMKMNKTTTVGTGSFLRVLALPGGKVFCAWEQDGRIMIRNATVPGRS